MGTAPKASRWHDLPTVNLLEDTMVRSGFRGDDCVLTFNAIKPTMKRWEPHSHPFDQIVLTLEGRMLLEVAGKGMECGPHTIVRIPGDVMHTGWPIGGEPVLNIDVFAPLRDDYLFLTEHQREFASAKAKPSAPAQKYEQRPSPVPFTGEMLRDTKGILFNWEELPTVDLFDGTMKRAGFRGDDCLLAFNWIKPTMKRYEPHSHPFDQVVLVVEGRMALEVDGVVTECGPGSVTRVPPNLPHTGWPLGRETVLNIDVFAPPRADYLDLVRYQKEFAPAG